MIKFTNLCQAGGIIAIAITIPIATVYISLVETRERQNIEYVRLAVGLLGKEPAKGAPDAKSDEDKVTRTHLRSWAIDVIQHSAEVKLTDEAIKELKAGATLPSWPDYTHVRSYDWTTGETITREFDPTTAPHIVPNAFGPATD